MMQKLDAVKDQLIMIEDVYETNAEMPLEALESVSGATKANEYKDSYYLENYWYATVGFEL